MHWAIYSHGFPFSRPLVGPDISLRQTRPSPHNSPPKVPFYPELATLGFSTQPSAYRFSICYHQRPRMQTLSPRALVEMGKISFFSAIDDCCMQQPRRSRPPIRALHSSCLLLFVSNSQCSPHFQRPVIFARQAYTRKGALLHEVHEVSRTSQIPSHALRSEDTWVHGFNLCVIGPCLFNLLRQ